MKSEFLSKLRSPVRQAGSLHRPSDSGLSDLLNRLYLTLLPIIVFGLVFSDLPAQQTGTIGSTVEIEAPVTFTVSEFLEFGQVRAGNCDGTVVVTTANVRFATPCAKIAATGSNLHSRAEVTVLGDPFAVYTMSTESELSLHDSRGDPLLGVTALTVINLVTFSVNANAETSTSQFNAAGSDIVYVGGTLLVPTGAKNGKYEGIITLTINF